VELEDGGGSGTALSHWKKRVFLNEFMTGTSSDNPVKSPFTLALLQDTGHYLINWANAEDLQWGKGLGCQWVAVPHICFRNPYFIPREVVGNGVRLMEAVPLLKKNGALMIFKVKEFAVRVTLGTS
jgi:hypothetical protein